VDDTQGFEEFYTTTVGRLIGVLFPVTGDLHEAEEIVQEAYARASIRWARLRDYGSPEAWVRRVAMNLATDRGRRLQRQARALLRAGPPPAVPPASVEAMVLARPWGHCRCTSARRSCSTTWSTCPSTRSRRSSAPAPAP
jgi:RNA polymerase sigma-70 factor, ECF subfamily